MKVVVLVGLLAGCAHVGVTTVKEVAARPEGCKLDVFTSDKEIKGEYEVLCLLDSKTGSTAFADRSIAGAINEARPFACQCGGEAILLSDSRVEGVNLASWGEGYATIKVIRFKMGH